MQHWIWLKSHSAREASCHQLLFTTACLVVTHLGFICTVDEFFLLFLVYLNEIRMLWESKVLSSCFWCQSDWMRKGSESKIFFCYSTQECERFPSDLLPGRWRQLSINYVLLKNVKCKVMFTEAYFEPSQTSTMELFCKNSSQLVAINYFYKNSPSQMFNWVLNTPLVP